MRKPLAALLAAVIATSVSWTAFRMAEATEPGASQAEAAESRGIMQRVTNGWRALFGGPTAKLRVKVIDAITGEPIPKARCVVGETKQEIWSQADGWTRVVDAPIIRDVRLHRMLAQLHGQMTLVCYKTGYRDTIFMGVRMHEGLVTEPEVWMIPTAPGERRVEPWLYQMPIHRIWRIELADSFRTSAEPGAGFETPER